MFAFLDQIVFNIPLDNSFHISSCSMSSLLMAFSFFGLRSFVVSALQSMQEENIRIVHEFLPQISLNYFYLILRAMLQFVVRLNKNVMMDGALLRRSGILSKAAAKLQLFVEDGLEWTSRHQLSSFEESLTLNPVFSMEELSDTPIRLRQGIGVYLEFSSCYSGSSCVISSPSRWCVQFFPVHGTIFISFSVAPPPKKMSS